MNQEKSKQLLEKAGFRCKKCSYYSPLGEGLVVRYDAVLCSVCNTFAPAQEDDFNDYIDEKLDWQQLETFRKYRSDNNNLKKGMMASAKKGKIVSRPPFGYKMQDGNLMPAENFDEVREIFEEFSRGESLNQISRNHKISVNGIKKILKNFTYIGKVKFDNQIIQGSHQPIISAELFNRVQQKFENKR